MHRFLTFILEWKSTCLGQLLCPSQDFFTVHTAIVYVIQVTPTACEQEQMLLLTSCQQNCMTYTIAVCTVKKSCDGQSNCPRHVDFHSKINLRNRCIYLVYYKKCSNNYNDANFRRAKNMVPQSFETSVPTCQLSQRNISENLSLQQHRCENLKCRRSCFYP